MLTETLPNHQYHGESMKQPCKKVVLVNKSTNEAYYCDNIPLNIDDKNRLCFSDLINELKPKYPQLNKAFFFIYLREKEFLLGADPFTAPRYIEYKQLDSQDIIILYEDQKTTKKKIGEIQGSAINNLNEITSDIKIEDTTDNSNIMTACSSRKSSAQIFNVKQEEEDEALSGNTDEICEKIQNGIKKLNKPREKRVKERTIEYVIQKVKKWRDIYENGVSNELGEDVKPNLDVAAYLVQLSRKTLDDYYAQLRKGEMYGFDFNSNKHQKMGMLRKYVKAQEKSNPNKKNKGKLAEIVDSNLIPKLEDSSMETKENNVEDQIYVKKEENTEDQDTMDIEPEQNQVNLEEQQRLTYIQAMQKPIQTNGVKKNRLGFDYYQYEEIMTGASRQQADVCDQFLDLRNDVEFICE